MPPLYSGIKYNDKQESKFPEEIEDVKTLTFAVGLNKDRKNLRLHFNCILKLEFLQFIIISYKSDATFGWMGFHNTFTVYFKHPEEPDLYTQV